MDTISEAITKYNNTAITRTTTIYGNLSTVNANNIPAAVSIANAAIHPVGGGSGEDYAGAGFILANVTNGLVDGSVSIPYPTPYVAISGFQYLNATALQGCPAGFDLGVGPGGCSCIMESVAADQVAQSENSYGVTTGSVSMTSTFYQILDSHPIGNDLIDMAGAIGLGTFDIASFSDFLSSASVFNSYPALRSCAIHETYNGPPALMIPAAALTATIKTTVAGVGSYNQPTPKPAGPTKPTIASQTAGAPSPTATVQAVNLPAPLSKVPVPTFPGIQADLPAHLQSPKVPSLIFAKVSTNPVDVPGSQGNQPIAKPPMTAEQQAAQISNPVLTFAGSTTYSPDQASRFLIAGQTVVRGGVITVSSTSISIAPGAALAVVRGSTQTLVNVAVTPKPVLTFAGSTYIADDSSDFAIAGQSLTKGGTINVGGTQMSLDQGGKDVVIGTSTQKLSVTSITAVQEAVITFEESTYTANSLSNFVIDNQTLTKGGIITVQGTPISYAAASTDVAVGTSTEAVGIGGYIMSRLGAGPSSSTAPVQFTGKAARENPAPWTLCLILGLLMFVFGRPMVPVTLEYVK